MEHQETSARPPFFRRHSRKLLALLFWLALIGGYHLYAWHAGLSTSEAVHQLVDFMATSVVRAPIFMALYTACPLVLFPVGLLAVAAGVVFGPAGRHHPHACRHRRLVEFRLPTRPLLR